MKAAIVLMLLSGCVMSCRAVCQAACAANPEEAARAALGADAKGSAVHGTGFRAEDLEIDPVLHRAWIRVLRCDAPELPAVLVLVSAPMKGAIIPSTPRVPQPITVAGAGVAQPSAQIYAGEWVRAISVSSSVRMELQAQAMQTGSEGQTILLRTKRGVDALADEPEHRIHGTVRANGLVEVVP